MRKFTTIFLAMLLIGLANSSNAQQIHGKWVVPTDENATFELTFTGNGITSDTLSYYVINTLVEFSAGGYNESHDLQFYVLGETMCYGNTPFNWISTNNEDLHPEFQIIQQPDNPERYFSFYTGVGINDSKHLGTYLCYNEINTEGNQVQVSINYGIRGGTSFSERPFMGFAITEEELPQRYLYASTERSNDVEWDKLKAGVRKWEITSAGVDMDSEEIIVCEDYAMLDEHDFDAYNFELIIKDNEEVVIA